MAAFKPKQGDLPNNNLTTRGKTVQMRQNTNGRGTSWISLLLFWSTIQTLYKADWLLDTYMLYRIGYWACWVRSSNIAERNEPQSKDSLEKVNLFYFIYFL